MQTFIIKKKIRYPFAESKSLYEHIIKMGLFKIFLFIAHLEH